MPDAWYFYTDEEILELNNITLTDDIVGEDYLKQLENATVIYDMYAVNEESGSSININLEKLNALQIATLDLKKTLEAQIDTIVSAYQNMGYTDVKVYYQKVTVDGKEFDGLRLTAKIQGIDFNGVVFTFRKSNYLANITLATLAEDTTGALLDCFTIQ